MVQTNYYKMKRLFLAIIAFGSLTLLSFDKVEVKSEVKAYTLWKTKCANGAVYYFTCDCSQENASTFGSALCAAGSN